MCTIEGKLNIDGGKHVVALCTYQCKPRGGGRGSADQIPQGGKQKVNQKCEKSPHPRGKNLNKQYYNTV